MLALILAGAAWAQVDLVTLGAQVEPVDGQPVTHWSVGARAPVWWEEDRAVLLAGARWTHTRGYPTPLHHIAGDLTWLAVTERGFWMASGVVGTATDFGVPVRETLRVDADLLWARQRERVDWGLGLHWESSGVGRLPWPLLYVGLHPADWWSVTLLPPWRAELTLLPGQPLQLRLGAGFEGRNWATSTGRRTTGGPQADARLQLQLGALDLRLGVARQQRTVQLNDAQDGPQGVWIGTVELALPMRG